MMKRVAVLLCSLVLGGLVACGGEANLPDDALLSWEAFKAQAYQEEETGAFITNGDELVESETELREAYDRYAQQSAGVGTAEQPLIVNRVSNKDDKWSLTQANNLTFCVSKASFGSRYDGVVDALTEATGAWEDVANVTYVHKVTLDGKCTSKTTGVVFNVRQVKGAKYIARAFFPSNSRSRREVLIDQSAFGKLAPITLAGVLRHELGHTLGFRHEHTRPEAGKCFENNSFRALTGYDANSVMHYPQCNGSNKGDLVLTDKDKQGAESLYP